MSTSMNHFDNKEFLASLQVASKRINELAGQLEQQLAEAAGRLASSLNATGVGVEEHVRAHPAPDGEWPAHQKRVIEEKRALDDRREKLDAFLETSTFAQLDDNEQGRMHAQRDVMADYSRVLGDRIEAFAVPAEA